MHLWLLESWNKFGINRSADRVTIGRRCCQRSSQFKNLNLRISNVTTVWALYMMNYSDYLTVTVLQCIATETLHWKTPHDGADASKASMWKHTLELLVTRSGRSLKWMEFEVRRRARQRLRLGRCAPIWQWELHWSSSVFFLFWNTFSESTEQLCDAHAVSLMKLP